METSWCFLCHLFYVYSPNETGSHRFTLIVATTVEYRSLCYSSCTSTTVSAVLSWLNSGSIALRWRVDEGTAWTDCPDLSAIRCTGAHKYFAASSQSFSVRHLELWVILFTLLSVWFRIPSLCKWESICYKNNMKCTSFKITSSLI